MAAGCVWDWRSLGWRQMLLVWALGPRTVRIHVIKVLKRMAHSEGISRSIARAGAENSPSASNQHRRPAWKSSIFQKNISSLPLMGLTMQDSYAWRRQSDSFHVWGRSKGQVRSRQWYCAYLVTWGSPHITPNEGSIFDARVDISIIIAFKPVPTCFLPSPFPKLQWVRVLWRCVLIALDLWKHCNSGEGWGPRRKSCLTLILLRHKYFPLLGALLSLSLCIYILAPWSS